MRPIDADALPYENLVLSTDEEWCLKVADIDAAPTIEQPWIPVTERLPTREDSNPYESVLAIHKEDGFARSWLWDIVERYHTEFTHWMPLPQPPKGDEG